MLMRDSSVLSQGNPVYLNVIGCISNFALFGSFGRFSRFLEDGTLGPQLGLFCARFCIDTVKTARVRFILLSFLQHLGQNE